MAANNDNVGCVTGYGKIKKNLGTVESGRDHVKKRGRNHCATSQTADNDKVKNNIEQMR